MFWGFFHFASGAVWGGFFVDFAFVTHVNMEYPVFSLIILEISFVELFFKRIALNINFLWDMLEAIFLTLVCSEFFHIVGHLLMESILLPCCISEGDSWVLVCRFFAFFEAVFACESFSSFSLYLRGLGRHIKKWHLYSLHHGQKWDTTRHGCQKVSNPLFYEGPLYCLPSPLFSNFAVIQLIFW